MSKIVQTICDRCGKPFEYRFSNVAGYFRKGIKVRNFFHFTTLFYGNPSGYEYMDKQFELCADCTNKLFEFLKGGDGHE